MTISYENRKGQVYFLHKKKTKGGKDNYYFSMKQGDNACFEVPEGFEIYEHPSGQVFLRKIVPKVITEKEIQTIKDAIQKYTKLQHYIVDVKGDTITIYCADDRVQKLVGLEENYGFPFSLSSFNEERFLDYDPEMQFVLTDKEKRIFIAKRFCYLGSIDDWVGIGEEGKLIDLAKKYLKHIGKESYYDLM